ncbi:glycine/sarcosine/betaine reductase complex component C subunit alpha [Aminivibrio sp.]|jgi:betaine reductase|uniref:glycine/sarcosine/betaine reductase complex component C subunit alpha n=1 Tax=Aminivibrio sp. TaxID=1872489 RepID=UPI001A3F8E89|nr:glycine/sarcosine/betaine reductase complex component C subunit alpha [Aminivibrio sp.]MBL3540371.1 glycine reductase [Aminivibrio sp.]
MSDIRKLIGEALAEIVSDARSGGPRISVGLMAAGSELGAEELARGARLAQENSARIGVVMIGPRIPGFEDLAWIETPDCEEDVAKAMEEALSDGRIAGAVALHYPFPLGVTTIGRVLTPGRGRPMILASSTGTSAAGRVEAMVRNALYGIAAAKAIGLDNPSVGILNVDGAQLAYKTLNSLKEKGYPISFGASIRKDGGAVLRGNDILAGAVDICVTDTLTGNVLMKMFSSFTTGGSYESLGWGYGPSAGEGWNRVISIISRASGAPVIAGALEYTARAAAGNLPEKVAAELAAARKAGLDAVLEGLARKASSADQVTAPPAEPTDEEIHGVDVLSIEDGVKVLWKEGIYAESSMGCTGPVIKVPGKHLGRAEDILRAGGYI